MNPAERLHEVYAHPRRVKVLAGLLSDLIPEQSRVLDVGCGDGMIDRAILDRRDDLSIDGVDVIERPDTAIPVAPGDQATIPHPDDSYDAVLLIDVLHHTHEPKAFLREAKRVARRFVLIKDHTLEGFLAGPTLRFMDRVGNARHQVALPHVYWERSRWHGCFAELGLALDHWNPDPALYPWPASWVFGRSLHFVARLGTR